LEVAIFGPNWIREELRLSGSVGRKEFVGVVVVVVEVSRFGAS
jgi:hypothetical protein